LDPFCEYLADFEIHVFVITEPVVAFIVDRIPTNTSIVERIVLICFFMGIGGFE
jgi:hypothetical protein